MAPFISRIRDVENALGSGNRTLSEEQRNNRRLVRRSPYLISDAQEGDLIKNLDIEFKRPGLGLTPSEWEVAVQANQRLKHPLDAGHMISTSDVY